MTDADRKKVATKLVIKKNKRVLDKNDQFNYVFEWSNNNQIVMKEVLKIASDEYNLPIEDYDLNDIILHKIDCCLTIDRSSFVVQEVEL